MRALLAGIVVCVALVAGHAQAGPVGELHRLAPDATAALRDALHRAEVRLTIWYPAAADATEYVLFIGPKDNPKFAVGSVAPDAAFAADVGRRPLILLSHGYGGSARMMGWFGIALARAGYIVVGVDHPGNNGADPMTIAGALLSWDRVEDLRAALAAVRQDPSIGPHIDRGRIGVAGFSAGGFATLLAAGARVEPGRLIAFCDAHPDDGICRPQLEFSVSDQDARAVLERPEIQAETARAGADRTIPDVRAAFAMAPAIVQSLAPASLERIATPVRIVLGDADAVAPPATNGRVAARLIPNASLIELPGVGHYDFLSTCTDSGRASAPFCKIAVPQDQTHARAIAAAEEFFARELAAPP